MAYIVRAFLQPGDEVLTSENTFIGFYILAQSVGATTKKVPLTSDYKYDIEKLRNKTRLLQYLQKNEKAFHSLTKAVQSFAA